MSESQSNIESAMQENRVFPPPPKFVSRARIGTREEYQRMYRQSIEHPDEFWSGIAQQLHWIRMYDTVLEWNPPNAKWFVGGRLNVCYNCVDLQIDRGFGKKTAILWEGEPMHVSTSPRASGGEPSVEVRDISYNELHDEVCKFANGLRALGVRKGDVVTIYMPMIPEAAIAMLACARFAPIHSVIFGGFSSQAIADRVEDAKSNILITADGGDRRGQGVPLKKNVDEALTKTNLIKTVVVLKRTGENVTMQNGRDVWWSDAIAGQAAACPAEHMDSEDLLFVLYTSGSTGKPKGIIHTTAGYLLQSYLTAQYVFDLR